MVFVLFHQPDSLSLWYKFYIPGVFALESFNVQIPYSDIRQYLGQIKRLNRCEANNNAITFNLPIYLISSLTATCLQYLERKPF